MGDVWFYHMSLFAKGRFEPLSNYRTCEWNERKYRIHWLKEQHSSCLNISCTFQTAKDATEILKGDETPYLHNKETIRDIIVPGNFKREGRTKSSKILKHITCSQSIIQETLWENQEGRNQLNSRVNRAKLSCQF